MPHHRCLFCGALVSRSDCPSEVFVVQFSPDGQLLAAGCNDGEVRVCFHVLRTC